MNPKPNPKPPQRCPHQYYDPDTGAPIGKGCARPDCNFIHPSDPLWSSADLPRFPLKRGNFGKDRDRDRDWDRDREQQRRPSGSDAGWGGRRDSGPWGNASPVSVEAMPPPLRKVTSSNAIPTGPRRGSNVAAASASASSGWGSAPMGGTAWGSAGESSASASANTGVGAGSSPVVGGSSSRAAASTSATAPAASSPPGWGASDLNANSGWGAPDSGSSWGAPTGGGWGEPASVTDDWGAPAGGSKAAETTSAASPTFPAAQHSPVFQNADVIWGDPKGKGKGPAPAPVTITTPQYSLSTPRTPSSPILSPDYDPRRKPSLTTAPANASPTDYSALASRETRKEREGVRLTSTGVYVSTRYAGTGEDAAASSSKSNPFSFPAYKPSRSVNTSRAADEEGVIVEDDVEMIDVDDLRSDSPTIDSKDLPADPKARWKGFLSTLSRAVYYKEKVTTLEHNREQQKQLHNSAGYQSASLIAAHAKLSRIEAETDEKLRKARKKLSDHIQDLLRYPVDGLPAPSPDDSKMKGVQEVDDYVKQTKAWMDNIKPVIEDYQEKYRRIEEARRKIEEETRRAEETRKRKAAEADAAAAKQQAADKQARLATRKRVAELQETLAGLEDRITDLENGFDDMRNSAPDGRSVVENTLVEHGIVPQARSMLGPHASLQSLESGELPFETPPPPKTREELAEECERLQKAVDDCSEFVARGLKQQEEWRQRNLTRERGYHELALDTARLQDLMKELSGEGEKQEKTITGLRERVTELQQELQRYKAERGPPRIPPPTADDLTARLAALVLPDLRYDVLRGVGKLQGGVQQCLREQQEDAALKIHDALYPALSIVGAVRQFIEQHAPALPPLQPPAQPQPQPLGQMPPPVMSGPPAASGVPSARTVQH